MSDKVTQHELCGFHGAAPPAAAHDPLLHGVDVLGITLPTGGRGKPGSKPDKGNKAGKPLSGVGARAGRIVTRTAAGGGKPARHFTAAAKTMAAAARAERVGAKTVARAAAYNPKAHATVLRSVVTRVTGTEIVVGVARALTAKQKAAIKRHNDLLLKHKVAVDVAAQVGKHAIEVAKKARGVVAKAVPVFQKMTGAGHSRVHGDEVLGDWAEVAGTFDDVLGDSGDQSPDPLNPGYLIDGSPDPAYGAGGGEGAGGDEYHQPMPPPFQPPPRGQPLSDDMALTYYEHHPNDAVIYDWSRSFPKLGIGSINVWAHDGEGILMGGPDKDTAGGFPRFYERFLQPDGKFGLRMWSGDVSLRRTLDEFQEKMKAAQEYSIQQGWGPLLGDPKGPLPWLQFAKNGNFFWQSDSAPKWATQEADQQLALVDKQQRDAIQAANDAIDAKLRADKLAIDEAQAKQDAELALQEQAEESASAIRKSQLDDEQAKIDLQRQQLEMQMQQQGGGGGPTWEDYGDGQGAAVDWGEYGSGQGGGDEEFTPSEVEAADEFYSNTVDAPTGEPSLDEEG